MNYFETIKVNFKAHIDAVMSISIQLVPNTSRLKIERHLQRSIEVDKLIDEESPQKLHFLTEYLAQEGRNFGWSFSENAEEQTCESSFWFLQNQIKQLIGGMSLNERLYYFDYLDEFEKLPSNHQSNKENILLKLFAI